MFWLHLAVVLVCMVIGARRSGVVMGLAGGLGVVILTFVFGLRPSTPPVDVLLIIASVTVLAATLQAAGGLDYLVTMAERLLRRDPNRITLMGPLVCAVFAMFTGTAYVAMALFPVIVEVAYDAKVRVERPLATSVVAASCGVTASPVSAATAAMISLLAVQGVTLGRIVAVAVPSILLGVIIASLVMYRYGKDLDQDPEFQARLAKGDVAPPARSADHGKTSGASAKMSVAIFALAVAAIVLLGTAKPLMPTWVVAGKPVALSIPMAIEMIGMGAAFIMVLVCNVKANAIVSGSVFSAGLTGLMAIFGIAWMADTFFQAHQAVLIANLGAVAKSHPWMFAVVLFGASAILFSQGATVRSIMPLGITLGIPAPFLIAMFPACNATFFIPATGTIVGAIAFDRTGTTRIGSFVLNHSFMLPGVVMIASAVCIGFGIVLLFG